MEIVKKIMDALPKRHKSSPYDVFRDQEGVEHAPRRRPLEPVVPLEAEPKDPNWDPGNPTSVLNPLNPASAIGMELEGLPVDSSGSGSDNSGS